MAFTVNGEKMALFMLLSSRSNLRFQLEGQVVGGTPTPLPDAPTFFQKLVSIATTSYGFTQADIPTTAQGLFVGNRQRAGVPDRQISGVSTDHNELLTALQLTGLYTIDNPCPSGANEILIAKAIASLTLS